MEWAVCHFILIWIYFFFITGKLNSILTEILRFFFFCLALAVHCNYKPLFGFIYSHSEVFILAKSIFTSIINHKYKIPCILTSLSQLQCTLHSYMAFFFLCFCIVYGMVSVVWSMCIRWGMNGLLMSLCMSVNEDVFILLCGEWFISFHSQKPIREQREWHSIPEEYLITQRMLFQESLSSCRSKLTFFLLWNIKHDILKCYYQTLTFIIQTKSLPLKVFL